jgi:hypothetical protein
MRIFLPIVCIFFAGFTAFESKLVDRLDAELAAQRAAEGYNFAAGFLDACGDPCIIRQNRGGALINFEMLGALVLVRKKTIIIDGPCASACALFADLARQYVTITQRASFHFHKTSNEDDPPHSPDIARWVNDHGGFPAFKSDCLTQMPFEEARRFWRPFFDWYAVPRKMPIPPWNDFDPLGFLRKQRDLPRFDIISAPAALPALILRGSVQ